jgi:hypothetical protein
MASKFHYYIGQNLPLSPILNHVNPTHTYFFLPVQLYHKSALLPSDSQLNFCINSLLLHACYMTNSYHHKHNNHSKNNFTGKLFIKEPNLNKLEFRHIKYQISRISTVQTGNVINFTLFRYGIQITNMIILTTLSSHHERGFGLATTLLSNGSLLPLGLMLVLELLCTQK